METTNDIIAVNNAERCRVVVRIRPLTDKDEEAGLLEGEASSLCTSIGSDGKSISLQGPLYQPRQFQ